MQGDKVGSFVFSILNSPLKYMPSPFFPSKGTNLREFLIWRTMHLCPNGNLRFWFRSRCGSYRLGTCRFWNSPIHGSQAIGFRVASSPRVNRFYYFLGDGANHDVKLYGKEEFIQFIYTTEKGLY